MLFKYSSGFTSCNMQILLSCYDICICSTFKCQNIIKHDSTNTAQLFPKPRSSLGIYSILTKLMRSLTFSDVKDHMRIQKATCIFRNLLITSEIIFFFFAKIRVTLRNKILQYCMNVHVKCLVCLTHMCPFANSIYSGFRKSGFPWQQLKQKAFMAAFFHKVWWSLHFCRLFGSPQCEQVQSLHSQWKQSWLERWRLPQIKMVCISSNATWTTRTGYPVQLPSLLELCVIWF